MHDGYFNKLIKFFLVMLIDPIRVDPDRSKISKFFIYIQNYNFNTFYYDFNVSNTILDKKKVFSKIRSDPDRSDLIWIEEDRSKTI